MTADWRAIWSQQQQQQAQVGQQIAYLGGFGSATGQALASQWPNAFDHPSTAASDLIAHSQNQPGLCNQQKIIYSTKFKFKGLIKCFFRHGK